MGVFDDEALGATATIVDGDGTSRKPALGTDRETERDAFAPALSDQK